MRNIYYLTLLLVLFSGCKKDVSKENTIPYSPDQIVPHNISIATWTSNQWLCSRNEKVSLSIDAVDDEKDPITYKWSCVNGTFENNSITSSTANWIAPTEVSNCYEENGLSIELCKVYVTIYDQSHPKGNQYKIEILVKCNSKIIGAPTFSSTPTTGTVTGTSVSINATIEEDNTNVVTSRGVCFNTAGSPTINDNIVENGSGSGTFSTTITDLTPNKKYYVRAYATNSIGTTYSPEINLTTKSNTIVYGSVTDIDGNTYKTVKIGTQTWMAENLKTTKYNDGNAIPLVSDAIAWYQLETPGYCWYNNDKSTYKATYGALYNWYAVNTGKLAPTGWHIPTDTEWSILTTYIGGEGIAGGKLKETGTMDWISPNIDATNETGFTALPGGERDNKFYSIGYYGFWWSASEYGASSADNVAINYDGGAFGAGVNYHSYKHIGYSVRCVKN